MADNVSISAGSGTTIAADDIGGGVLAQRVKPVFGVDGTGVDVSASNPFPVTNSATGATSDAAWTSGNGTVVSLLKAVATNAISTSPSPITDAHLGGYEAVAASASAQVIGSTGAAGDFLSHVVIVPASTSPGAVTIQDGAGSAITIFAGGSSSLTNLASFAVPLGMTATTAWKVTTGASVSAIAVGSFT